MSPTKLITPRISWTLRGDNFARYLSWRIRWPMTVTIIRLALSIAEYVYLFSIFWQKFNINIILILSAGSLLSASVRGSVESATNSFKSQVDGSRREQLLFSWKSAYTKLSVLVFLGCLFSYFFLTKRTYSAVESWLLFAVIVRVSFEVYLAPEMARALSKGRMYRPFYFSLVGDLFTFVMGLSLGSFVVIPSLIFAQCLEIFFRVRQIDIHAKFHDYQFSLFRGFWRSLISKILPDRAYYKHVVYGALVGPLARLDMLLILGLILHHEELGLVVFVHMLAPLVSFAGTWTHSLIFDLRHLCYLGSLRFLRTFRCGVGAFAIGVTLMSSLITILVCKIFMPPPLLAAAFMCSLILAIKSYVSVQSMFAYASYRWWTLLAIYGTLGSMTAWGTYAAEGLNDSLLIGAGLIVLVALTYSFGRFKARTRLIYRTDNLINLYFGMIDRRTTIYLYHIVFPKRVPRSKILATLSRQNVSVADAVVHGKSAVFYSVDLIKEQKIRLDFCGLVSSFDVLPSNPETLRFGEVYAFIYRKFDIRADDVKILRSIEFFHEVSPGDLDKFTRLLEHQLKPGSRRPKVGPECPLRLHLLDPDVHVVASDLHYSQYYRL